MDRSTIFEKVKSLYITVRDPSTGRSKTMTVRGEKLTPANVLRLVKDAIRTQSRKAS